MSDWSAPVLSTAYATLLTNLKDRDVDAATLFVSVPTNPPTGAFRYLRANDKFQEYDGAAWQDKVLAIAGGGTGGASAAAARTALGIGTMGVQDSNNVTITGGAISGVNLNASNLTSGTVALARLANISNTEIAAAAAIAWTKLSKAGSSLAELTTRSHAELSDGANVAMLNANAVFTLNMKFGTSQNFSWNVKAIDTVYQAASDGLVLITMDSLTTGDGIAYGFLYSDAANPPTTQRARVNINPNDWRSFMAPVRKGDFYKLTTSVLAGTVNFTVAWIPLGTAG